MSNDCIIVIARGKAVKIHWLPTILRRQKSKKMGLLLCSTGFKKICRVNTSRSSRHIEVKEGYDKKCYWQGQQHDSGGDPAKAAFIEDTLSR